MKIFSFILSIMTCMCSVFVSYGQQIKTYTVGNVTFAMVTVEAGTFTMGATPEQKMPYHDELPTRRVKMPTFSIGQVEVTQALWVAVMGKNPSEHVGNDLPVERVSWVDCQAFIERLNRLTGQKFRLPTEAEWEFAARGGNLSKGTQYAGGTSVLDVAWCYSNSGFNQLTGQWSFQDQVDNHCGSHPVATQRPNELGIYDMSGNVWEWVQDYYSNYPARPETNPHGPVMGNQRVIRGGSWAHRDYYCRLARRVNQNPSTNLSTIGFRLAL